MIAGITVGNTRREDLETLQTFPTRYQTSLFRGARVRLGKMIMKKLILCTSLLILQMSSNVLASESSPIIVTATRTAQTVDETLSSVTVITREQIEQQQATSVQDVLRGVPGLTITNNGGAGKLTSLFLRGTESDHIVVLIDGLKVGSATSGSTAFENIPIDQIERIEIVRGPHSALYGSEAIGGVIQIFTRKGGGALRPSFSYSLGTYNTYKLTTGVSGGGKQGWFNFHASGLDTEGFNACKGSLSGGCFTVEPDKDGYREGSASLRTGYKFDNQAELDFHWLRVETDVEYDGGFQNASETAQNIIGGSVKFQPVDIWNVTLGLGQSRDESDSFLDGVFSSRFVTKRDNLTFQNDLALTGRQLLTVGMDLLNDRIDSTTAYLEDSRYNIGTFAQYQIAFSDNDLQLNLRNDANEQFGTNLTGGIAWGVDAGGGLRFTASYGTAFKAPTFNELYFPGFGNANLKPENSESIEFGLRQNMRSAYWQFSLFETQVDNLIGFDAGFNSVNIDKARITGLEMATNFKLSGWSINAAATWLDAENRSPGANFGNELARRASETLRLDADSATGPYRYGVTLNAVGQRYDDLANTKKLNGYATVDVRGEYAFDKDWLAQMRIANLFDKDYETAQFYNQPGVSLYVTLRYQPQSN